VSAEMSVKIKLSRTMWLVLGIAIFVIAFLSLYIVYHGRANELNQANANIAQANSDFNKVTSEKTNLQSQLATINSQITQSQSNLAKAMSELDSTQENLPKSVESIEYDEKLVQIATESGLEVSQLTFSEPRQEKVEKLAFSVTPVRVQVKGTVSNMLSAISKIAADNYFRYTAISTVTIEIPEPTAEETPSALIELAVYTYEGE
jgi:uncharacterized phage infection (PIP) family protein YhgE